MSAADYQKAALATSPDMAEPATKLTALIHRDDRFSFMHLMHGVLVAVKESSELLDLLYEHIFYDTELDLEEVEKELGDIQWGVTEACSAVGITLGKMMRSNIKKLRKRFPDGFSAADARRQKDKVP